MHYEQTIPKTWFWRNVPLGKGQDACFDIEIQHAIVRIMGCVLKLQNNQLQLHCYTISDMTCLRTSNQKSQTEPESKPKQLITITLYYTNTNHN